jgi:hypothetical protein
MPSGIAAARGIALISICAAARANGTVATTTQ